MLVGLTCSLLLFYHLSSKVTVGLSIAPAAPQASTKLDLDLVCETSGCVNAASYILARIDTSVDPCDNFYQYSCGKWLRETTIPDHKTSYSSYEQLREKTQERLRKLMDDGLQLGLDSRAINITRQLYRACMNTTRLDEAKSGFLVPVMREFHERYGQTKPGTKQFTQLLTDLKYNHTVSEIWSLGVTIDDKNTSSYRLGVGYAAVSSSLALGSRTFYLSPDEYRDRINALKAYITSVCDLLIKDCGLPEAKAGFLRVDPEKLVAFETKLANISTPPENLRNATELYNPWTFGELKRRLPSVDWDFYLKSIAPEELLSTINDKTIVLVSEPKVVAELEKLLSEVEPSEVINYIRWALLSKYVDNLDERYRALSLPYLKVVSGVEVLVPRWKVCVGAATGLSRAVSAMYVDQYTNDNVRQQMKKIATNVAETYSEMISKLDWMDEETKKVARDKLRNTKWMLAYPDYIKNATAVDDYYKRLQVDTDDDYLQLSRKLVRWAQEKSFLDLLEPVDRDRFDNSFIVNAFYSGITPSIIFPAAWLQPPYFDADFPLSINYGGVGSTFGHEFTHGFDDEGSQYDRTGNLREWWSETTKQRFLDRTQCIIDQYSSFQVKEIGLNINGKLTQGENIADNGGVKEAYKAYKKAIADLPYGREFRLPGLQYTPEQLFFMSFATSDCDLRRPASLVASVLSDPHSPAEFRILGPLSNMDEFAAAFNCKPGSPMNPLKSNKTKCSVW